MAFFREHKNKDHFSKRNEDLNSKCKKIPRDSLLLSLKYEKTNNDLAGFLAVPKLFSFIFCCYMSIIRVSILLTFLRIDRAFKWEKWSLKVRSIKGQCTKAHFYKNIC